MAQYCFIPQHSALLLNIYTSHACVYFLRRKERTCVARYCVVCLSVCPSVTLVDCDHIHLDSRKIISLINSIILPLQYLWILTPSENWKGNFVKHWCQKFSSRSCFGRQLLASGQDRQQTLHTCYFWQAASAGVHSTVPAHSKCAYAA